MTVLLLFVVVVVLTVVAAVVVEKDDDGGSGCSSATSERTMQFSRWSMRGVLPTGDTPTGQGLFLEEEKEEEEEKDKGLEGCVKGSTLTPPRLTPRAERSA